MRTRPSSEACKTQSKGMAYYNSRYIELTGTVEGSVSECADPVTLRTGTRFNLRVERFKRMKGASRPRDIQTVIAWDRLGEHAADTLRDGDRCIITGEIRNGIYTSVVEAKNITRLGQKPLVKIPEVGTQISIF